jgi:hypothetical protein
MHFISSIFAILTKHLVKKCKELGATCEENGNFAAIPACLILPLSHTRFMSSRISLCQTWHVSRFNEVVPVSAGYGE